MNEVAQISNPFGSRAVSAANNAVANSQAEREIQEVQAAMVIAKRFPRNQIQAMDRILNACTRPTLANSALYCYPRGGQEITGPSIRLAEALAQEWGNIQFGIRELSSENGKSTVEAFAWDIETNTRQVKVFQVEHSRYAKGQVKKLTDPRDIYEMVANQGARRLRACILGVIPGDVVESAVEQCETTQKTHVDVGPETITKMINAFEENYGVTQELIETRLGKRVESINASQLLNLKKIYQSLKDGMSKPSDWFAIAEDEPQPKATSLKEELKTKQNTSEASAAAKESDEAPAKQESENPAPGDAEPKQKRGRPAKHSKQFETLHEDLMRTNTENEVKALFNYGIYVQLGEEEKAQFDEAARARVEAFKTVSQ